LHDDETENGTAEAMDFRLAGRISGVQRIAAGKGIRDLGRLNRMYGRGRWRKLKGVALVRDRTTGEVYSAEIHWYEAAGIGRKEFKIKRSLESR
jgi:hypothetical protein